MVRSLFEKNGQRLTASAHLGQYILIVFKQEVERIKNELTLPGQTSMTRDVSMIFDGSTRQGEAVAVIMRFLDNNWSIIQRLIRNQQMQMILHKSLISAYQLIMESRPICCSQP